MEKLKVSKFIKDMLLITEDVLAQEDKRLFAIFQNNDMLYNKDKNTIPINLFNCFTHDQVCELKKLFAKSIILGQVNSNSIVECHRLSYIRSTALLLIQYGLLEKDINIEDNEIYKNYVIEILPAHKYYSPDRP